MPSALAIAVGPKPLRFHLSHRNCVYGGAPAAVDARGLRFGNALKLAFLAQVRFEFGKDAENIEKALPRGCAGVDRLFSRLQGDATLPEVVDDVLQVAQRTGKPVDPLVTTSVSPSRRH